MVEVLRIAEILRQDTSHIPNDRKGQFFMPQKLSVLIEK
jgi:hypothetical protein